MGTSQGPPPCGLLLYSSSLDKPERQWRDSGNWRMSIYWHIQRRNQWSPSRPMEPKNPLWTRLGILLPNPCQLGPTWVKSHDETQKSLHINENCHAQESLKSLGSHSIVTQGTFCSYLWIKTRKIITVCPCLGIAGSFFKPAFHSGASFEVEGPAQVWKLAMTYHWGGLSALS